MMRKTFSVTVVLFLLCQFVLGDELSVTLDRVRAQFDNKNVLWAHDQTDPLLAKYADDKEALKKIYKLRITYATGRAVACNYGELEPDVRGMLSLLSYDEDLPSVLRHYQLLFSRAGWSGARREFDGLYQSVINLQKEMPVEPLLLAHREACLFYNRWGRNDVVVPLERLVKAVDMSSPELAEYAYPVVANLLTTDHMLSQKYELMEPLRESILKTEGDTAKRLLTALLEGELRLAKTENMVETTAMLLEIAPDDKEVQILQARALAAAGDYEKAAQYAYAIIANSPDWPQAFDAHVLLVEIALRQGQFEKALGQARVAFNIARDEKQISDAIRLTSQVLAASDGHFSRANQYILFQKYGQAGPDGVKGTEDDLPPFHKTIAPYCDDALKGNLLALMPDLSNPLHRNALRKGGYLLLNAGMPEEALKPFLMQYFQVTADRTLIKQSADDLALGLRAYTGQAFGAGHFEVLLDIQKGIAFPDDLAQTAEREFQAEISRGGHSDATLQAGFRYASALMLSRHHDQAVAIAYSLLCAARDNQQLTDTILGVASTLKGRDSSVAAANAFIAYQKHGPHGPDSAPGTEDDLVSPVKTPVQLPDSHRQWLRGYARELEQQQRYRDAADAYLLLVEPRNALLALKKARSLTPFEPNAIQQLTRDIVAAFTVYHGPAFRADEFFDFLEYGPHGKDGIPRTPDDLVDPFAEF